MFSDPRLKKWLISFRGGSLVNEATRNVKLQLEKIFQKPKEIETEVEDAEEEEDVEEIVQPDPKKARLARKFKFGNIESVKKNERSSETIEEIFAILKNLESFNENPMLIDVKDEAFCPFKWWLKVVEKKSFLEPLMKKIFILLSERLASSFSEQIFSFAGRTSKGDQSRTGVLKLNGRQFVHCNIYIMMKKFKEKILDVSVNREKYIKAIEDWVKEVETAEIELETEDFNAGRVCENCTVADHWTRFIVAKALQSSESSVMVMIVKEWVQPL